MSSKKFFTIFMIIFMLFSVSGCGGSGGHIQNITNNPVSPDKPAPIHEPKSDDITIIPEPSPLSQDKPVSQEPIPTPIISHDPVPTPILYTVTFNSNGGSAVSSITVSSGNTVTKPNDPSKYGYTFDGWYKDSALTQVFRFGSNGDKVTGNITLYAKWFETDRLRAEIAIGKISIGYQDGDNANSVTKNLTLPTLVNASGDVNVSWSSNAPSVISNSGIVTRPSDNDVVVSLTAQITVGSEARNKTFTVTVLHEVTPAPSGCTVTFNSNGGSAVASIHTSSGGTVIMPENPVREGYVFAGWYKDEAFTEIFTFGADGDKITKDTTLHAQWLDKDLLRAEYSASKIAIGYANGDGSKHVTKNLMLPVKIDSVDISWSSSSGAVATDGTVTRQTEDVYVTLTATATYNGKSAEPKTFSVRVIRRRTRDNSAIKALSIEKASSGDIEITRNNSGDIMDIEGQYVSFDIRNADDALDAVTVLREELGIRSPDKELTTFLVTYDEYGAEYSFQQVYNGIKVFGRSIMVSANASGIGDFLHSSFLNSDILDSADMKINLTPSQAEERAEAGAKSVYSGNIKVDTTKSELVVYSLENYNDTPIYVYIVRIYARNIDYNVFVDASTGHIIDGTSNILNISRQGTDELGHDVTFEVTVTDDIEYLYNPKFKVQMFVLNEDHNKTVPVTTALNDRRITSAYTNIVEIMQWWKTSFDRNSLNNAGKRVDVVVHDPDEVNNAAWVYEAEAISIGDIDSFGLVNGIVHSYAVATDVLTHETTHAVIHYDVPGDLPYKNATGAINEGYADVFGCVKEENWLIGEKAFFKGADFLQRKTCIRNIANPNDNSAQTQGPTKLFGDRFVDYTNFFHNPDLIMGNLFSNDLTDNGGVHTNSFIISHVAYLMHQDHTSDGLTWDELGQVWYKSIHMGLSSKSNFKDVRRCVIWAAKELRLNDNKLDAIRAAFDSVGISETKGTLKGTVSDYDTGEFLSDVDVTLLGTTVSNDSAIPYFIGRDITPRSGRYSFQLEAGKYTVIISKQGYVPFTAFPPIEQHETSEELTMDVRLVKSGSGSLSGTIRRTSDNTQLQGVTVNLCSGWYAQNASVLQSTTTNAEGRYSFASLSNGYYTIAMLKDGYESKIFNITVCGDVKGQNGYLVWGDEPVVAINEEYFPDDIFRRYVRGEVYGDATDGIYASEGGLDSNGDGILSKIEVENTTWLRIDAIDIKSLKGIEYFTALQELNCSGNKLTALDVSKNTALRVLNCSNNQLTTLDVSHNIALTRLECADNQLTTLNVSGCSTLDYLFCFNNQLTYLDISSNTALTGLNCGLNKLMTLDVSHNTALMDLWCQGNKLTTIDVKHNTVLTQLGCSDNQLTVLDVSRNIALTLLECAYNKLTTLNVSACSALTYLECHDNQLTTLDLSNCPNLSSYNNSVICDSEVMVIWHSSMTSSAYTLNTSPSASLKFDSASMILAVLPSFTLDESGTYAFTVSLDRKPPEGSSLLLLSDSEDIHGTFTKTESPLSVNVSADFMAGKTYIPVIVATSEGESQSGGCNAGIAGIILLAGIIIVLSKIGHVREMRGRE